MSMSSDKYDDIYSEFITITRTQNINYPDTDEKKYDLIKVGIDRFNIRTRSSISMDNISETVSRELQYWEIRIIALYMKYNIIEGNKDYKTTLFDVFTKEIGVKNINAQTKSAESSLKSIEYLIDEIIFNMDDEEYYGEV